MGLSKIIGISMLAAAPLTLLNGCIESAETFQPNYYKKLDENLADLDLFDYNCNNVLDWNNSESSEYFDARINDEPYSEITSEDIDRLEEVQARLLDAMEKEKQAGHYYANLEETFFNLSIIRSNYMHRLEPDDKPEVKAEAMDESDFEEINNR